MTLDITQAELSDGVRSSPSSISGHEDGGYVPSADRVWCWVRLLLTRESSAVHIARLRANLPRAGVVTVLELTERQYSRRLLMLNTSRPERVESEGGQLTLVL